MTAGVRAARGSCGDIEGMKGMANQKLGRLKEVRLRDVWPNEATDFTKWLGRKENLSLLGEEIGVELEPVETESPVGSFSVDVLANDSASGRPVVIENQLEETNHDHLGKVITYAAGKDASVVVWVVRHAREEHANAIEWLNEHTDDTVAFFLVEIHVLRIGSSDPAPKFEVIERPNDWAKTARASSGLSETKQLQYEYWQAYCDQARDTPAFVAKMGVQKPHPRHYCDIGTGHRGVNLTLTINSESDSVTADIYVRDNFPLLDDILSHSDELEQITGIRPSTSRGEKDGRVRIEREGCSLRRRDQWHDYISWQLDTALKLRKFLDENW